jgi:rubrerythrin
MTAAAEIVESPEERETERLELVCGNCGYGVVVVSEPPACPMCRSTVWRRVARETIRFHAL